MAAYTYAQAVANATDPTGAFQGRCVAAAVKAAVAIYNEAQGTAGHAARAALAVRVLNQPANYASTFAYAVAMDPTILAGGTAPTDAQIDTALAAAWNALAGA